MSFTIILAIWPEISNCTSSQRHFFQASFETWTFRTLLLRCSKYFIQNPNTFLNCTTSFHFQAQLLADFEMVGQWSSIIKFFQIAKGSISKMLIAVLVCMERKPFISIMFQDYQLMFSFSHWNDLIFDMEIHQLFPVTMRPILSVFQISYKKFFNLWKIRAMPILF